MLRVCFKAFKRVCSVFTDTSNIFCCVSDLRTFQVAFIYSTRFTSKAMDECAYLTFKALFDYLDATPNSRCINEGQAVLNAKHLITCGVTEKTAEEITIFALSLQTSALTERPHEVNGTLRCTNGEFGITKFLCSCKAGNSGQCKHIAAVLLLCTRDNILELPQLSSTDLKCYWTSRTSEEQYTPAPMLAQECIAPNVSPTKKVLSGEEKIDVEEFFANFLPDCAYGKHRTARRKSIGDQTVVANSWPNAEQLLQLNQVVENCAKPNCLDQLPASFFTDNCCQEVFHNLADVDVANIAVTTKINKEMWNKERQFRITGSRCYAIYTYSKDDWKTKSTKYFWPKKFSSKYTDYGTHYEAAAREAYSEYTGYKIAETGLLVSKKQPWLAFTPDGIIFEDGKPAKLLEIKCPYPGKDVTADKFIDTCTYLKCCDGVVSVNEKHLYYAQMQIGMLLLNLQECNFVLYSSFDQSLLSITVKYNEAYSQGLVNKLHFNYFGKMLHHICLTNLE